MFLAACQIYAFVKRALTLIILFVLLLPIILTAQLWNGNLGDPVINYDFGAGNSVPLKPGVTTYNFSKGCPNEKDYSLEYFLFGCKNNTWILLTGDHTHNTNGNYMLVNAAQQTGMVFNDTATGLCANTTYQFAAWLCNAAKNTACGGNATQPVLQFTIESLAGDTLGTYTTPPLPITNSKDWVEYGLCYTTPANPAPLVLKIKSIATASCGSVFIMDDVTLRPAGPTFSIDLDGDSINLDIDLCRGYTNRLLLHATYSAGYNDAVLQWQISKDTGNTWQDIPGANAVTYAIPRRNDSVYMYRAWLAERVNSSSAKCRIYSVGIKTTIRPMEEPIPLAQVIGCFNKDLVLNASPYFITYSWIGPKGFTSNLPSPTIANIQADNAGLYTVLLTNNFGCKMLDSFQVNVYPSTTIRTPTSYKICQGKTVQFAATGSGQYEWFPSTALSDARIANPVANSVDSIQYKVVLTNNFGCKDSATVNVDVFKNPEVNAGPDKIILAGDTVLLDGSVSGTSVTYQWSSAAVINNPNELKLAVAPPVDMNYILTALSTVGCGSKQDAVSVKVFKDFFVPTSFTPNGDGLNDVFHFFVPDSYHLNIFSIYNRLGQVVFSTTDPHAGWDGNKSGQPQDPGKLIYYLEMKSPAGKIISRKGSILLIR